MREAYPNLGVQNISYEHIVIEGSFLKIEPLYMIEENQLINVIYV